MDPDLPRTPRSRGLVLAALTALFAARVAGQLLQATSPTPMLPPAAAFQGSATPYPLLLVVQFGVLAVMAWFAHRVLRGEVAPSLRWHRVLRAAGSIYLAASIARIAVGLLVADAPSWFRTWIPAAFHVVLGTYVLVAARCHSSAPGGSPR